MVQLLPVWTLWTWYFIPHLCALAGMHYYRYYNGKPVFKKILVVPGDFFEILLKKTIHMYHLNQHVIWLFWNFRIQCLLNLAYLYTSDAFIYVQKCLFMFQCSQAAYFVWGCTKSKLQSSNPQDRNWLTVGYGNKQLSNRFEPNFYIEDQKSRCSSQPLW